MALKDTYDDMQEEIEALQAHFYPQQIVYPYGKNGPPVIVVNVLYNGEIMTNVKAAKILSETHVCSFCKIEGHSIKECEARKSLQCKACGFIGHNHTKCNAIKTNLKFPGKIGHCTYKKCKGEDSWGHYIVTCQKRQDDFGDYIFPENVDTKLARNPVLFNIK